jgi:hypothetical protein
MSKTNGHALPLLPGHLADLKGSGLTDDTIRDNDLHSESDVAAVAKLLGCRESYAERLAPVLVFPYRAADGTPVAYCQVKPDSPQPDKRKKSRLRKYETPKDAGNRAYFPAGIREALRDPSVQLVITEGAQKALAATQAGQPTIALSGVWNFIKKRPRSPSGNAKGRFELIDDLGAVEWRGRQVVIIFDSDIAEKKDVQAAEHVLARLLEQRGAVVRVVRLKPRTSSEGKPLEVGLDDFLVAHGEAGPAALREAIAQAGPVPPRTQADGADGGKPTSTEGERRKPTQAEVLLGLAATDEHWHVADGRGYATVRVVEGGRARRETLPIRGKEYRSWLSRRYYQETGKAVSVGILQDVLGVLEDRARYDGPELSVYSRVGQDGGRIYVDLCDRHWRAVEVDAGGWRVLDACPVRFRRARGMLPLPTPERGGAAGRAAGVAQHRP